MAPNDERRILIAGASGYVGGRLLRCLEERSRKVRCLARRPEALDKRVGPDTEVVQADLMDPESLQHVFEGVDAAYYLVHSLESRGDFEAREERTARNFADACRRAGVRRIIYLGGLCDPEGPLSPHMRSRLLVGEILRSSGVETVEFRASIILGSGSLSFELIRALVQRLPVMITPRWVSVKAQPIAVSDVLAYLVAALELPPGGNRTYEIGGAERLSYLDLMKEYGRVAGLRRLYIPVPALTPWLSSLWLGLVTPLFASIGRRLIESITTPSIVKDNAALHDFDIRPVGVRDALVQALHNEEQQFVETHWTDALSTVKKRPWAGVKFGNRIIDHRECHVGASADIAFGVLQRIGGKTGWYYGNWLWRLRGFLDRMVGGVGMGRGRRDPETLRVGDALDCWRVEVVDAPRRLVLAAEMRLPGRAWLQFEVIPDKTGCTIAQTALYDPYGLSGLLYWYALFPVHFFIFSGMLNAIASRAALIAAASSEQHLS